MLDKRLLPLLACPVCKSGLRHDATADELICIACMLAFPIREGIPVMLPEEARPILSVPEAL